MNVKSFHHLNFLFWLFRLFEPFFQRFTPLVFALLICFLSPPPATVRRVV